MGHPGGFAMSNARKKLLILHIPIMASIVILGAGALGLAAGGRAVPLAQLLAFLQALIWLRLAARRFGRRRAVAGGVVVGILIAGGWNLTGLLGTWGIDRQVVIASKTIFRGGYGEFAFAVSPDERWLVYARESGRMRDIVVHLPEIVLRDLASDTERVLDLANVPAGQYFTVAEEITDVLDEPHWRRDTVSFRIRRTAWLEIEFASASARARLPKDVTPLRPSVAEMEKIVRARQAVTGPFDAAVSWEGESLGPYVYVAVDSKTSWRRVGAVERRFADGPWERLATRHGLFTDWWVQQPVVSPDDRLVAYTGSRETLVQQLLRVLIPILGMAPIHDPHLFVVDIVTGREYALGRVHDVTAPQWSGDGRTFYFADLNPWEVRRIHAIRFDVGPAPQGPERIPWQPSKTYHGLGGDVLVQSRDVSLNPGTGTGRWSTESWATHTLRGVSFRYPADVLVVREQGDTVRLEPDPDGASPLAGSFTLTISVVDEACDEIRPARAGGRRMIAGASLDNILNQSWWVGESAQDREVDRWYHPLGAEQTLVVGWSRSTASNEGLREGARIFTLLSGSIRVDGRQPRR
jgi:hypothetical protein